MKTRRRVKLAALLTACSAVGLAAAAACGGANDSGFGGDGGGVGSDGASPTSDGSHLPTGIDAAHDAVSIPPGKDGGHDAGTHDAGSHADSGGGVDSGHDATVGIPDVASPPPHDSSATQVAIVYGHSSDTLYSVDPNTKAVTTIGMFGGPCAADSVIDIALDSASNMYATGFNGVYTVDKSNAACTLLSLGSYPNSLSFVPAGTVDPNVEALVGYNGATYVRIDTTSGALTTIGSLGSQGYASSGDIVSVIGGGTYLTVTGGPDNCGDCLVSVDPTTGTLIKDYGALGYSSVFGIAFWAGNVYGFDSAGDLFEVTFPDAGPIAVTAIPIPNAPAGLSFYGAGSTTSAPRK